ncbi:MAG: peptide deformylase [Rhodospirillum sp.]|nr:peptide deformylase [Rhodospirillum sp.]MCF8491946.1 peptide deformylase [Rhodospirillum sp.]MCF8501094.1 peptide deformylase [Rhodospirillum sp.]
MALLKIARMGTPVLAGVARPVTDPTAPDIARLVDDMRETLADSGGVGLAAPQVHVPLRLVIFHVPSNRTGEDEGAVPETVLINPVITPLGEERAEDWEGCLSLPGLTGRVSRFTHIRYEGLDLSGAPLSREARGFHARVVQHECDHLDGVLYPMRMSDMAEFGYVEEMRKALAPRRGEE